MVARITPAVGPDVELSEQELSDAAYLRADGRTWEAVAILLGLGTAWLAVRRAAEGDLRFARLLKGASRGAAKEAEAVALRRLRAWSEKDAEKVSVKASQVLVEYAAEQERNETQLKIARLRAETEREKLAARAKEAEEVEPEGPGPVWPTREEERAEWERKDIARAAEPNAEVYLWGGNHVTNVGFEPGAHDQRIYMHWDHSFGRDVYWAIPERAYLASGRGDRPIRPEDLCEKCAPEG